MRWPLLLLRQWRQWAQRSRCKEVSLKYESQGSEIAVQTIQPLDPETLLQAIRDARREMERWRAFPSEEHGEDALAQVRHFRELHAILKRVDRSLGIARDRLDLA